MLGRRAMKEPVEPAQSTVRGGRRLVVASTSVRHARVASMAPVVPARAPVLNRSPQDERPLASPPMISSTASLASINVSSTFSFALSIAPLVLTRAPVS